jgi:proteasome assembly chaperone (PAC2) family protein
MGVSGLLLGLAKKRNIPAITLLAETYAHPMYLGVNGAKEIINILNKKLGVNVRIKELEKEIQELEKEMLQETMDVSKSNRLQKIKNKFVNEMNYIG